MYYTLVVNLGDMQVKTLRETLAEVDSEAMLQTLAERLIELEAKILGDSLSRDTSQHTDSGRPRCKGRHGG